MGDNQLLREVVITAIIVSGGKSLAVDRRRFSI